MNLFLLKNKPVFVFFLQWLLIAAIPFSLSAQSGIAQFDHTILLNLQNHRTPAKTKAFLLVSNSVYVGDIGIPAGLLIVGMAGHDRQMRQNALYVVSSTVSSYVFTSLIKFLIKRPRPFLSHPDLVPVYRASQYSFPSGHSASAFATATALSVAYPKWYILAPAFAWSSSVGYSRMYLGVHYPTDVAGGAFLGAGNALSFQFIRRN